MSSDVDCCLADVETALQHIHKDIDSGAEDSDYAPSASADGDMSLDSDGERLDAEGQLEDQVKQEEAARDEACIDADIKEAAESLSHIYDRWAQPFVDHTPPVPGTVSMTEFMSRLRLEGPKLSSGQQLRQLVSSGVLRDGELLSHPDPRTATRVAIVSRGQLQDVTGQGFMPYDDPSDLLRRWLGGVEQADGWQLVVRSKKLTLGELRDQMPTQ